MQEQMGNMSREMEALRMNLKEMLENKYPGSVFRTKIQ